MSNIKGKAGKGTLAIFLLAAVAALVIAVLTTTISVSAQSDDPDWKLAPTGLTVTAGDQDSELDITWDANSQATKTLSSYRVAWAPDGEDFRSWTDADWNAFPTTNRLTVTGLSAGETYKVRVRARYDDNKKSRWSGAATGQSGAAPDPTPNSAATRQPVITGTAQARSGPSVTIQTSQTQAHEGGLATFTLKRTGGSYTNSLTVQVKTWETNHLLPDNATEQFHDVTFGRRDNVATLEVLVYKDQLVDDGAPELKAQVQAPSDSSYTVGTPDTAAVGVIHVGYSLPAGVTNIGITVDDPEINEGGSVTFTVTRSGETTQPVTVDLEVDDPSSVLHGNHWDPPPDLPTQVEFGANETSKMVVINTPDDQRDTPIDSFKLMVLPSHDYVIVGLLDMDGGYELSRSVKVIDNDTPQELELNFGKDSVNNAGVNEGNTLGVVVKRRQQDADNGTTATFTVRLETDRAGDDNVLTDWTEDTSTGRLYKDFLLDITGSDLQVTETFTASENGESEANWDYWASIRPLIDHQGTALDAAVEAKYWTVKSGFRETTVDATDTGASNGKVILNADVSTVVEGEEVVLTLTRKDGGPIGQELRVQVETLETNRVVGFGNNPSIQRPWITFPPWEDSVSYSVYPYVDGEAEDGVDRLQANIHIISGNRYTEGNPNSASVDIDDPPSGSAFVTLSGAPSSMAEGESATFTLTRTGGDTTQPLTVDIRVHDPQDFLRGNHWDAAPDIPTQVEFTANALTQTLTLTTPDDQRALTDGNIKVWVLPGTGYLLANTGVETSATVSVTDNDTPQVLSLKWGYLDFSDGSWEEGEPWLDCTSTPCTSGPAEGTFYYEDSRTFRFSEELEEHFPAHFEVRRRAEDIGKTVTFIVRVEHNRDWEPPRHSSWPVDPVTGNHYQEFPLTLTGNQTNVVGRIELLDNGLVDNRDWQYSATIENIENADGGTALSSTEEAEYWTVTGPRKRTERPYDRGRVQVDMKSSRPNPVAEGQQVTFKLERQRGNSLEPLTVQLRTWEPNRDQLDGTNPTEQTHDIVFPSVPMTSDFVDYVTQTRTISVATQDDSLYEPRKSIRAKLFRKNGGLYDVYFNQHPPTVHNREISIIDDDQPTITLSASSTSVTEGETLTFTLTRGNNTTERVIAGVSVDDPGGFLQGDNPTDVVAVPSSIVFEPGDVTKTVDLTPPDNARDIPDSTLTFTVAAEPEYEILGSPTATVAVADNDTAPQVQITFNQAEVDEGNDLILTITRTGELKNDMDLLVTAGPVDNQEHIYTGFDPGQSEISLRFRRVDDNRKTADVHYEATLHPESPEFWIPTGPTTINAAIIDDDPYRVGVSAITQEVDEGSLLYYRVFHDGYTGESLQIKVSHAEGGSAVPDGLLGATTHTILMGSSGGTRAYLTEARDGNDGDATFTIEILPSDAYAIDPAKATATVIVRDKDPLPVLGFRDVGATGSEGDGIIEFWVDILSPLPSLRTVSVDYEVRESDTLDGDDIVDATGTLTFAPGETSAVIQAQVLQDLIVETNDTFTVILTNPVHATLQDGQTSLTAQGTVEDDEARVTVVAGQTAVDEGSSITMDLTRTGDITGELTVWLQVLQTAPKELTRQDTVVFAAGNATAQHTITTESDYSSLGNYTVTVYVLNPVTIGEPSTYLNGNPSSATTTVRETRLTAVNLEAGNLRVIEGETITLTLTRASAGRPLTVNLDITETGQYTTGTLPTTVNVPWITGRKTIPDHN